MPDGRRLSLQNSAFAIDDQRVPRIVPALKSRNNVGAFRQPGRRWLALAFIAPLGADYDDIAGHGPLPPDEVKQNESGPDHDEPEGTQAPVLPTGDGGDSPPPGPGARRMGKDPR